jgi:hypothetical protein
MPYSYTLAQIGPRRRFDVYRLLFLKKKPTTPGVFKKKIIARPRRAYHARVAARSQNLSHVSGLKIAARANFKSLAPARLHRIEDSRVKFSIT